MQLIELRGPCGHVFYIETVVKVNGIGFTKIATPPDACRFQRINELPHNTRVTLHSC